MSVIVSLCHVFQNILEHSRKFDGLPNLPVPKMCVVIDFWGPLLFGSHSFVGAIDFWGSKILGERMFFGFKTLWGLLNFGSQKMFESKFVWGKQKLGIQIIWGSFIFRCYYYATKRETQLAKYKWPCHVGCQFLWW